jgi:hypothetical protein
MKSTIGRTQAGRAAPGAHRLVAHHRRNDGAAASGLVLTFAVTPCPPSPPFVLVILT